MKPTNQEPNSISNPTQAEQEQLNQEILLDSVRVGDVTLTSATLNANDLANLLVEMLKEPNIKAYLDIIKEESQKKKVGYLG